MNTFKTLRTCLLCLVRSLMKFYGFKVAVCSVLSQYRCVPKLVRFELLTAVLMETEVLCDNNAMYNGLLFGVASCSGRL